MKVMEILQAQPVTEENLVTRLKNTDWNYEFAESSSRQRKGHQAMAILEEQMYTFWKKNPDRAVELWVKHSPFGIEGVTPSFIMRMEAMRKS